MLPKQYRNIKREYFSLIYAKGKRYRVSFGSISCLYKSLPNSIASVRFAVTTNKEFKSAIERNSIRRRIYNILSSSISLLKLQEIQEDLYMKSKNLNLFIVVSVNKSVLNYNKEKIKTEILSQINEIFTTINN